MAVGRLMDYIICRRQMSSLYVIQVECSILRIKHLFQNGRLLLTCIILLSPTWRSIKDKNWMRKLSYKGIYILTEQSFFLIWLVETDNDFFFPKRCFCNIWLTDSISRCLAKQYDFPSHYLCICHFMCSLRSFVLCISELIFALIYLHHFHQI